MAAHPRHRRILYMQTQTQLRIKNYMTKQDIKSMLPEELKDYFESIGERAFRAGQVFRWLHNGARTFGEMTDLPETLRIRLENEFTLVVPEILEKQVSRLDGTVKYLWRLWDGNTVESVVMDNKYGFTICISTQVGCRMGCVFCASAIGGLIRDLKPSEMLDQVQFLQMDIGKRISNIVLMGIGEPLDNFENVMRFLTLINHPAGMNIGQRHITLSTCGILEMIDKLAEYDIQSSLAVSLHAPDDETRSRLMPINRKTGVDRLLRTCAMYASKTGRRVSYEYALISGVNDTPRHAEILAKKLKNTGSHLNLILLNNVPERAFQPSSPMSVKAFTGFLKKSGVNFTVRRRLGGDIDASCGQLRGKKHGTLGNN